MLKMFSYFMCDLSQNVLPLPSSFSVIYFNHLDYYSSLYIVLVQLQQIHGISMTFNVLNNNNARKDGVGVAVEWWGGGGELGGN